MSAQSQTEIRVGTPGAFGASVGVVNAPYNIITSMPGGSAGSAGVQEVDAGSVFGTWGPALHDFFWH